MGVDFAPGEGAAVRGAGSGGSSGPEGDAHATDFALRATDGDARRGRLTLRRGAVETPAFMPVGTSGTVKGIQPLALAETGAEMILANAYHLMLRPGAERVARLGGLHRLARWPRPMLTDSGGFQVMSLSRLNRVEEEGVVFSSHIDGALVSLTPERAIAVQVLLGAEVAMVLDECISWPADESRARAAMERSLRWAARCRASWRDDPRVSEAAGFALFGIVQGGTYGALRRESAESLRALDFSGYALGGLAVGEGRARLLSVLDATVPHLPSGKPRYLMGVGAPIDLVEAVGRGCDLFDCVLPTRLGRTGVAFVGCGALNLRHAAHAESESVLEPGCPCPACAQGFVRAWLHHLVRRNEMLGCVLLTLHNLTHYQRLMARLRMAIERGRYGRFARSYAESASQSRGFGAALSGGGDSDASIRRVPEPAPMPSL